MAVITVSRELAALGDETARELAKQLGYRFIDKNTLEERMKTFGIEDDKINKFNERKPSLLSLLSQDRDDYLHYLKTAVFTEAERGNCVLIGRGAAMMFKNVPGCFSIFLAAPPEIRVERVKSYFHCDERRAKQIIERSDQDRAGFHRYFFDLDWRDPGNYHLVFNTGIFHPAACAEIVMQLKEKIISAETEALHAVRLKELVLEQRIKHHIVYEREIAIHFLEVTVTGNTATLYGVANSQTQIDAALNAAREAAGKAADSVVVQGEIQIIHEYSVMP